MMDCRPEPRQCLDMFRHGVTHVALKAVARMIEREPCHQAVARHLGNDRGRRNRGNDRVTADHGFTVAAGIDAVAPVNEDELRAHRQRHDGARQCPQRGTQDVVAVDPRRRRHRDRDLGAGADLNVEFLARFAIKLLGIVEAARHALRVENDGSGDDRPRQRPATGLVAACDRPDAALERRALAAEGRPGLLLPERQAGWAYTAVATHAAMVRSARRKSMLVMVPMKDGRKRPAKSTSQVPWGVAWSWS